jgi:DNA-binding transcriptional LysR family regulator
MWTSIELRDLRVFITLADELHFGRTGELLGLTPSRVSQIVRSLERRIGGRLFERTSRSVSLTLLGEQLQRSMLPAYRQMESAFSTARVSAAGLGGTIRIGMYSPANGGPHLLDIIAHFKTENPSYDVELVDTGIEHDQFEWLRRDRADLLAMRLPISAPDVVVGPTLSSESRVLAVADNHPLADRDEVTLDDLVDYVLPDVPSLPPELMNAFIPPVSPSARRFDRVALNSLTEAFMRVAAGEVVHPTVLSVVEFYPTRGITLIPLRGLPPSETALVWLAERSSHAVDAMVASAKAVLNDRIAGS